MEARLDDRGPQDRVRVLALAVPDALDTTLAMTFEAERDRARFVSTHGPVEGAVNCNFCAEQELGKVSRKVAAADRPTHLIVRDGTGEQSDLEACRRFVEAVVSVTPDSLRCVIQTHPTPRTASTARYDRWLKVDSGVHGRRGLNVVWHDPLIVCFLDCLGESVRFEHEHGAR